MVQSQDLSAPGLNAIEHDELAQYEAVIERGIDTFVEVGQALVAIRDGRLYRAEYRTFEDYCRERWGFNSPHARRLIRAAEAFDNLRGDPRGSVLPTGEKLVRPLTTLAPELQRDAWQRAVETAPDGKITAGHVQRVVDEMTRQDDPEPPVWVDDYDTGKPILVDSDSEALGDPYGVTAEPEPPLVETPPAARLAVHFSSDTPEHYTPREIIEATVNCLGVICLDPCSNSHERPNVPAAAHFTQEDDGLAQAWNGTVYMNPPYGREIGAWVEKLCQEHESGHTSEAIALVPARPDTQWWRLLRDYPVCFITGRLKFGGNDEVAPFPSAVFYLGNHIDRFYHAFRHLGDIWQRIEPGMFGE